MAITIGSTALTLAFILCAASALSSIFSCVFKQRTLAKTGALAALGAFAALTVACGVLVVCFFTGDVSIAYVAEEMTRATGAGAWLFKVAGLWGGSAGSLLFWAWLIALFNAVVAHRVYRGEGEALDTVALGVAQVVLLAFLGVTMFSGDQPFSPIPTAYLDAEGNLSGIAAQTLGMNMLLEHWAMAVHPPTLFVGYAGFTIPFAYAVATLALGNATDLWVRRSTPYALVSWLFLTIGIGLGAVWAYVVLGWGGYWGWDPVENASLLPWLVGLALIHSFTVVRQRGAFKRWAPMCACLAFAFVVLGTFITRSGIVQSVHAFEGDVVSLSLFLGLIVVAALAGIVGVALRWKTLAAADGADDIESFTSKDAAYYMNNLVMIIFAFVLAYFTLASALPTWLPLGGMSITTGTYESIARPLGILYCALMALCPLLSWSKTDAATFKRRALVPAICAVALFAVLLVLFFTRLLPAYNAIATGGGAGAADLLAYGPSWYYNALAVVGFAVASLLFFNAGFVLAKAIAVKAGQVRARLSLIGGSLSHAAMAVILVGLVGSAMYVTKQTYYLPYDEANDAIEQTVVIRNYELVYTGSSTDANMGSAMMIYTVNFDVTKDGRDAGSISPRYNLSMVTGQTKLDAGVKSYLLEDLFVVFNGFSNTGKSDAQPMMVLEVRTNPLIGLVWAGFGLMLVGMALSLGACRSTGKAKQTAKAGKAEAEDAKAELPTKVELPTKAELPTDAGKENA